MSTDASSPELMITIWLTAVWCGKFGKKGIVASPPGEHIMKEAMLTASLGAEWGKDCNRLYRFHTEEAGGASIGHFHRRGRWIVFDWLAEKKMRCMKLLTRAFTVTEAQTSEAVTVTQWLFAVGSLWGGNIMRNFLPGLVVDRPAEENIKLSYTLYINIKHLNVHNRLNNNIIRWTTGLLWEQLMILWV